MKRSINGICHLCGIEGKLSYEHVPPRAAFNNRPLVARAVDQYLIGNPNSKTKSFQRGAGAYTLCPRCNNTTGRWYGTSYVEWVRQGMEIFSAANQAPSLFYNFRIYPLRIIKQIVCMFFSVNTEKFREAQPELEAFVLDKRRKFLPEKFKVFVFYTAPDGISGNVEAGTILSRQSAVVGRVDLSDPRRNSTFTEITFPPFGYIATFDNPPEDSLYDISFFGHFGYDQRMNLPLKLPVLPVIGHLPGDYRSRAEIDRAIRANDPG